MVFSLNELCCQPDTEMMKRIQSFKPDQTSRRKKKSYLNKSSKTYKNKVKQKITLQSLCVQEQDDSTVKICTGTSLHPDNSVAVDTKFSLELKIKSKKKSRVYSVIPNSETCDPEKECNPVILISANNPEAKDVRKQCHKASCRCALNSSSRSNNESKNINKQDTHNRVKQNLVENIEEVNDKSIFTDRLKESDKNKKGQDKCTKLDVRDDRKRKRERCDKDRSDCGVHGTTKEGNHDEHTKPKRKKNIKTALASLEIDSGLNSRLSRKLIGAHCSIAKNLQNAVEEAVAMGGHAFGLFLKSQRTWTAKPLEPTAVVKFQEACKKHGFSPHSILPHGSYLLNLGSPNAETWKKSREAFLDELQRCETLGLTLYNFHPGSTCGEISVAECMDKIADSINWAHSRTKFVITVVENMSGQGNTLGGHFEELRGIIDRVKDKSRIGICLDTCHAFAAGFDLSTEEGYRQFVADFDRIVGFKYLKAVHLNDSKGELGCNLDRHENIGKGHIGLEGFRHLMTDPRFDGIPMILETPSCAYDQEIKTLYKMAESASA